MDIAFFKGALKYHATLSILSVFILYLLKPIFNDMNFVSNHPYICLVLFVIAINACLKVITSTSKDKSKKEMRPKSQPKLEGNKINRNKAKNIRVITDGDVTKNEITDNEADGDLTIGQGTKNGKL